MKKITWLIFLFIVSLLISSCKEDPKKINYLNESASESEQRMAWWNEARFGMFIHWGLYSVPAGEWNGETNHAEWIRTTAQIPLETYDQFVNEFNPVNYKPEEWVNMAKNAGMKYIVITSKHHDGFCLFDSKYTDFDIMSTPYGKDLLKPLADAAHREGLKICWYHSIMDWHHPDYLPRRGWETDRSTEGADYDRYIAYMKNQLKELVENYGDIGVLWFDGEWEGTWSNEYGKDLYNYVRNLEPTIIINNRVDVGRSGMEGMTRSGEYAGDFGTPEQEIPATGLPGIYWETCMTMNDHWGYNKNDANWKSTEDLIRKLVDIASKGGNFLLNIGPKANGEFPQESIERLNAIGDWMHIYSKSIYETHASPFDNLEFGRCTQRASENNTILYLHIFNWPENNRLTIPGIYNEPIKAYYLSDQNMKTLATSRNEDAIEIDLGNADHNMIDEVLVLEIAGKPDISTAPVILAEHSIFIDSLEVKLESGRENVDIRFTTDGKIPDSQSTLYTNPIYISGNTTLTTRCFRDGKAVSGSISKGFSKVEPWPSVNPGDLQAGILAAYYEGDWDSLPNFNELIPMEEMIIPNFSVKQKKRDDYYAFHMLGWINITEDRVYTFHTESDDGSNLFIDKTLVVDNDGLHGMEMKQGVVALAKGYHQIEVNFFEKNGGDDLKVYISGKNLDFGPIPENLLFTKK